MKRQTLAMANGFERYMKKTRRAMFLEEIEQMVPWSELCALIEPCTQKWATGGRRWEWNEGCGFIFCSSGLNCPILGWKKRCTIRRGCSSLWVSIWGGSRCRAGRATVWKLRHLLPRPRRLPLQRR
jgi:hypothetical protein